MQVKIILYIILILWMSTPIYAHQQVVEQAITVEFQQVELQRALAVMAKFFHQNILLSPAIKGYTTLYFKHSKKEQAFNLILTAHDLEKQVIGDTWFVAPHVEFDRRLTESVKQRTLQDMARPLMIRIWPIYYAKAQELASLLQVKGQSLLSKRGQVQVDTRTNTLCIQDTTPHLIQINAMIKRLDIPVQQVLIEARLISIDQDYERELGVNFVSKSAGEEGGLSKGKYSLALANLAGGARLDVQLAALESEGHGEIISTPSLFTANQQPALIESGEEIPYQEVSEGGGTAVSFKKAVLSLKVTPQVLPNNKVLLRLQVNQDRPNHRVVLGVPAISTRQISTHILVGSGQTIVLGGIYEANQEQAAYRTPFFGKIPLVGWLFKQENVKNNKRELLIFVTPKIISFKS